MESQALFTAQPPEQGNVEALGIVTHHRQPPHEVGELPQHLRERRAVTVKFFLRNAREFADVTGHAFTGDEELQLPRDATMLDPQRRDLQQPGLRPVNRGGFRVENDVRGHLRRGHAVQFREALLLTRQVQVFTLLPHLPAGFLEQACEQGALQVEGFKQFLFLLRAVLAQMIEDAAQ